MEPKTTCGVACIKTPAEAEDAIRASDVSPEIWLRAIFRVFTLTRISHGIDRDLALRSECMSVLKGIPSHDNRVG
jgi:hypothetical protein